jgi:hypothetical protein
MSCAFGLFFCIFSQTRRLVPALPRRCSRTQVRACSRPRRRIPARGARPRIVYLDRVLDVVISTAVEDEAACARRRPWTPRIPRARRGSGTCIACTTSFHVPWRSDQCARSESCMLSSRRISRWNCVYAQTPGWSSSRYVHVCRRARTVAHICCKEIANENGSQTRSILAYLPAFRGFPHALWE